MGYGGGTFVKVPPHPLKTFWFWSRAITSGDLEVYGVGGLDSLENGDDGNGGFRVEGIGRERTDGQIDTFGGGRYD